MAKDTSSLRKAYKRDKYWTNRKMKKNKLPEIVLIWREEKLKNDYHLKEIRRCCAQETKTGCYTNRLFRNRRRALEAKNVTDWKPLSRKLRVLAGIFEPLWKIEHGFLLVADRKGSEGSRQPRKAGLGWEVLCWWWGHRETNAGEILFQAGFSDTESWLCQ